MNYTLVSFHPISEEQKNLLIAILPEFGFHGMEETEEELKAYTIETDTDFEGLLTLSNQMGVEFQLETLEEENWNTTWESNFDPVVIPGKIQVRAHFHPPLDFKPHRRPSSVDALDFIALFYRDQKELNSPQIRHTQLWQLWLKIRNTADCTPLPACYAGLR